VEELVIKVLLRIHGDLEDIEMVDGIGLKHPINQIVKSLLLDINIQQFL
jgi:hypothetical protein